MASELFLGPDGGPYVSVNENSGDIELKDNSGNVVMKWDESNTQWDVQSNDIQNVGSLGVEETHTETISSGERHYAGDYDGGDADERLDNALSTASAGETVILENENYTDDRTISTNIRIQGSGDGMTGGSQIRAVWTLNANGIIVKNTLLGGGSGQYVLDSSRISIVFCGLFGASPELQVNADNALIVNCASGAITFASGTSGGLVDSCIQNVSVTDSGTNTVGDVA